ncbi:hypothetical protein HOD20_06635 [archaeon]|jgi:hypothetical protein|nr:hypothetical protein [archaeon]MBT4352180.1 hypothetical protein [archaeon]MBT4647924.1 hypothetical protein [archaeon]MBT7393158.1 hypothetical protein [archaeon]
MNKKTLISKWKKLPKRGKIISILFVLLLLGLSTRSWQLTIIAWIVMIYIIIKLAMDYEIIG